MSIQFCALMNRLELPQIKSCTKLVWKRQQSPSNHVIYTKRQFIERLLLRQDDNITYTKTKRVKTVNEISFKTSRILKTWTTKRSFPYLKPWEIYACRNPFI